MILLLETYTFVVCEIIFVKIQYHCSIFDYDLEPPMCIYVYMQVYIHHTLAAVFTRVHECTIFARAHTHCYRARYIYISCICCNNFHYKGTFRSAAYIYI